MMSAEYQHFQLTNKQSAYQLKHKLNVKVQEWIIFIFKMTSDFQFCMSQQLGFEQLGEYSAAV